MKENLAPSCHTIQLGEKLYSSVNFETKLVACAFPNKKESAIRLAKALTHAKSLLHCEKNKNHNVIPSSVEDIAKYTQEVVEYLSLVKGFLSNATKPMADVPPGAPAVVVDPLRTTPVSALNEPLIDPAMSPPAAYAPRHGFSRCLNFCDWTDILTNTTIFAPNAKHEYAQSLLATGIIMLYQANSIVDTLIGGRISEIDEKKLKVAYQLFLHAAGVFDACVVVLGVTPRNIGAKPGEVSNSDGLGIPNEEAMAKWRAEQQKKISDSASKDDTNAAPGVTTKQDLDEELNSINRVPDLAEAILPQVFGWIALAEGQELVILRGISREFIDFSLMAKLSIDVSFRYQECQNFITQKLPCQSSSVAEKLRVYAAFKDAYYAAISVYYQGAVCLAKEQGPSCALAIANFKKAKQLIDEAASRKTLYDAKFDKEEIGTRKTIFDQIFLRSQQIIQRDLDIAVQRNDSVYYERIPDPELPIDPLGLVRQVPFPTVHVHELWNDPEVASCLNPSVVPAPSPLPSGNGGASATATGATATGGALGTPGATAPVVDPTHKSCCSGCVIS